MYCSMHVPPTATFFSSCEDFSEVRQIFSLNLDSYTVNLQATFILLLIPSTLVLSVLSLNSWTVRDRRYPVLIDCVLG
jgi:hypothetical protein